jgi:predicted transcriptional regulator
MERPEDNSEAADIRYRTLSELEKVLRLLVDHHGARMTLGEMLAITAGMARLCRKSQVTIAEIAEATGLPKQNLSRWARKRVGDSIALKVNENDQRVQDLVMTDAFRGQENIERLAGIFGTDRGR